jgi:hypothetical protein
MKEECSFLKKRTKKLLPVRPHRLPGTPATCVPERTKVFWFFFFKKEQSSFHFAGPTMAPAQDAGRADLAGWLSLCANTQRLWRQMKSP